MDAVDGFREAIQSAGLTPPETIEADGQLHRYSTDGTPGDDAGWYVYHDDGVAAGAFGDWRSGLSETWCARSPSELSPAEREAHRRTIAETQRQRDAERDQRHAEARTRAAEIWTRATPETGGHRYLRDRQVQAYGIRSDGQRLIVPMRDTAGALHSLQYIDPRGEKRYLTGGRVDGCYHAIGTPDGTLCICEGYATAASVHEATGHAVAVAFSAGNLEPVARALRAKYPDLRIIVCGDNDASGTGQAAAHDAARAVGGRVAIPAEVGDWNDVHQRDSAEAVREAIEGAAMTENSGEESINEPAKLDPSKKQSAATILVEMAESQYQFGVSTVGETFALPKNGPKVVSLLRGSKTSLRGLLARQYFRHTGHAAPQQSLADALLVIDGLAQEAEPQELYIRVARHGGSLWLDLGDASGRAICVTGDGWTVEDRAPVLFKRTVLTGTIPAPVSESPAGQTELDKLQTLWKALNVTPADRPLVAAWLVSALFADMPHPVLGLFGEQGTGKTTALKMLVSCIDPGPVPTRKPPRDGDGWVTAAAGSWIVGIDNASDIQAWLSDSLCRAVTGDGDVRRKLYTDGEQAVFAYRRVIALNSIDLGAVSGDLADRMLSIQLETIPDSERIEDEDIWPLWREAHPRILGAILDLAAKVVHISPSTQLASMPRMADFARKLATVDKVLGTDGLSHYRAKVAALAADSLTGDHFVMAILREITAEFRGTAAELLNKIAPDKPPKGWPATPRAATQRLRRQAPSMRKAGWIVADDGGQNKRCTLIWTLAPPEIARISSLPDLPTCDRGANGKAARQASQEYSQSQDGERDRGTI